MHWVDLVSFSGSAVHRAIKANVGANCIYQPNIYIYIYLPFVYANQAQASPLGVFGYAAAHEYIMTDIRRQIVNH